MGKLIKAIKFGIKYQSCVDEVIDLATYINDSVKDKKLTKEERSKSLSKFWTLVKAIENA